MTTNRRLVILSLSKDLYIMYLDNLSLVQQSHLKILRGSPEDPRARSVYDIR